jgi:hypothetical protein
VKNAWVVPSLPPHVFTAWWIMKNGHTLICKGRGEKRTSLSFLAWNLNDKLKMRFEIFAVVKISYGLVDYTAV